MSLSQNKRSITECGLSSCKPRQIASSLLVVINHRDSSVTAAKQDGGISKFLDSAFDTAYNETQIAGDLPHVRWGRIDYLNVTTITTKWAIWQCVSFHWRYLPPPTDLLLG